MEPHQQCWTLGVIFSVRWNTQPATANSIGTCFIAEAAAPGSSTEWVFAGMPALKYIGAASAEGKSWGL